MDIFIWVNRCFYLMFDWEKDKVFLNFILIEFLVGLEIYLFYILNWWSVKLSLDFIMVEGFLVFCTY